MTARKPNNLPWIILGGVCGLGFFGLFGFGVYSGAKAVSDEMAVGQTVELPRTDKISQTSEEPITIRVTNTGQITLDDKSVDLDSLVSGLMNSTDENYSKRIDIRGARDADYHDIIKIMARVSAAGFTNLGLVTEPASAE